MSTNPNQPLVSGSPPDSGGDAVAGQTIGKYKIVRGVGVGGMAQVFLATREGPEGFAKPYVIKRILPEYSQNEQFAKLFVIEAKVAAMLDHPNIVHVFDFEIENGSYYLVMEYVAGTSLSGLLRANRRRGVPLGAHLAVEIGAAVAHALAYAHGLTLPGGKSLDLVHRDVSPGNVLVSRDGAIKLADFGVVKTSMTATVVGVVNGKWAYMSPEQISGQVVDQRSDLFSLGIVLYEVITGIRLFRGESAAATARRVMEAEVRRPRALVPDLDQRLDDIVMKLLQRDLGAHYQLAAEVAADLDALRALPGFAAGTARLRGVIRALFPEESAVPALGASFGEYSHATLAGIGGPFPGQSVREDGEGGSAAFGAPVPFGGAPPDKAPTWRFGLWLGLACLGASGIFWLVVLLTRNS